MSTVSRSALVPVPPEAMFAVVNGVREYPQFLDWCPATDVLEERDDEMLARLHLSWKGIKRSFTTRNCLQPGKMIEVRLVDGPFHHLEGFWRFEPLRSGTACKVAFDLEFELAAPVLGFAFGPVFTQIANSLVDSFTRRALDISGRG